MKTYIEDQGKLLFPVALLIFLALVAFYWKNTWDDSAITLAFSRNLVKYGDIIPSQYSDRVEGYSSALWMFINAGFFMLGLGEKSVLLIAKAISTILGLINILLFWQLLNEKITNGFYKSAVIVLYVINLQTITAAVFGMENALYALLVMGSYLLYKRRNNSRLTYAAFTVTTSLLVLIRHEGSLFLIPFVVDALYIESKRFWREPFLYVWAVIFLAYHSWHFSFFGELLTNPMIAKRQPPYLAELHSAMDFFLYYLFPFFRFIAIYPFLVIVTGISFIRSRSLMSAPVAPDKDRYLVLGIAFVGGFIMLITGVSWNNDAERLSYPALAFIFILFAQYLDKNTFRELLGRSNIVIQVIVGAAVLINTIAAYQSFAADQRFRITVDKVRNDARLETLTQEYLHLDRITLASPDMGGLLLFYGDGKRIIDLGLLCNRELAKQGYEFVDTYVLAEEKPEIIEIHDIWITPFVNSDIFYEKYTPAQIIDGNDKLFIFFRNDLIQKIEGRNNVSKVQVKDATDIGAEIALLLENYDYFWTVTFAK